MVAVVGPNGSGKSTLMRIVLGLVHHDGGSVRVFGQPMPDRQAEVKQGVGFVSDDLRLHRAATLRWHANLVRSLCSGWDEPRARELADQYRLPWDQPAGGFSRGQAVKALLLLTLARRPRLLLLDEPTAALDAGSRDELLDELVRLVRRDGLSILVSSHNAEDFTGRVDGYLHLPESRLEPARPALVPAMSGSIPAGGAR
jgi:ABC-2 type transport system ATP-binding protein